MAEMLIRTLQPIRAAGVRHDIAQGTFMETWQRFMQVAGPAGMLNEHVRVLSVFRHKPDGAPGELMTYYAAVEIAPNQQPPEGMELLELPGREYAGWIYTGPYEGLAEAWGWYSGAVEEATGRKPADADCFEVYLNDPGSTPPDQLMTELNIPLE